MERKTNKIVQRFERVTHHQISLIEAHGKRHGSVPNVDRARTQDNEFLVGDANLVGIANARIADIQKENEERKVASLKKRRRTGDRKALEAALLKAGDDPHRLAEVIGWPWDKKNAKPFTEGILSILHDWFLGEDGKIADTRVDEFRAFAVGYVQETFGDDLIYARLDLDEKTPHLQFVIAPEHENPKSKRRELSHRQHRVFRRCELHSWSDGLDEDDEETIQSYELLQSDVADYARKKGLDVERGMHRASVNRARQANGDDILRREHVSPARGRELAAEIVSAAEEDRELAESDKARSKRLMRDAERHRTAALRTAADANAYARALEVGTGAIEDERIVYRPPVEEKPEGLRWGPNAPKEEKAKTSLQETIRPAMTWLIGFARRMLRIRKREAAMEARVAEMERREAEQRRRAAVLAKEAKTAGQPAPMAVRHLMDEDAVPRVPNRAEDFPGAFAVPRNTDMRTLSATVDAMKNRDVRARWAATSDACALAPRDAPIAGDFERGCRVLEAAAAARGFDLENGKHDPTRATDASRATLHTDHNMMKIRVIRRDRQRQRVRGG